MKSRSLRERADWRWPPAHLSDDNAMTVPTDIRPIVYDGVKVRSEQICTYVASVLSSLSEAAIMLTPRGFEASVSSFDISKFSASSYRSIMSRSLCSQPLLVRRAVTDLAIYCMVVRGSGDLMAWTDFARHRWAWFYPASVRFTTSTSRDSRAKPRSRFPDRSAIYVVLILL